MAYKQIMGKGPAMKTGAGIPKELMSGPAMHEGVVHEGTDPKGKTTVTRQKTTQDGVSGTLLTATTQTPGSGGDSLSGNIIRTPEGDAAYAAKSQAEKDAQDARFTALNARKEGSTNTSTRFTPDAPPPTKPMGYIPGKANIKAEGIKPMASNRLVTFQAQRGTADDPNNTQRGVSGTNAGRGSMTMDSQVMTVEKANEKKSALNKRNKRIEEKYANNPNQEKAQARVKALQNKVVINKYK